MYVCIIYTYISPNLKNGGTIFSMKCILRFLSLGVSIRNIHTYISCAKHEHYVNLLNSSSTEEACLDPNDPKNAKFLDVLQSVPLTSSATTESVCRLRQLHDKERFVSDEEFANERRFVLLEHRQQGVSD